VALRSITIRREYLFGITGAGLILVLGAFFLGRRSMGSIPGPPTVREWQQASGRAAREGDTRGEVNGRSESGAGGDEGARQADRGVVRFEGQGLKLANLRIEPVGYGTASSRLEVTGTVEPNLGGVVKVTPRVAGKITSIRVNVGDTVGPGQTLATLASTELAQAQTAYQQAQSRVAVAVTNLQRQKKLASLGAFGRPTIEAARSQGAAARAEAETARNDVDAAQAGVIEAESQLRALQAAVVQAETQVNVAQSRFNRADLMLKEGLVSRQDWEQTRADSLRSQADLEAARANVAQGQAKIESARANLHAAQARFAAARQRARIASQSLAREEVLYKGGYVTSKEIVAAEADWRQARLEQRAASNAIQLLGSTPEGGHLLNVAAPLGGRVTERLVTLGETVTVDKPLFTIVNLRTVWVQLNLYQQDLPAVRLGQAVTVTSDTAPGRTFHGAVSSISDVLDETTRTVKVRVVIHNVRDALKPKAFVRGTIAGGSRTRALLAPGDAIQVLEGRTVVFIPTDRAGEFRPRPVEVGARHGARVEIRSGLKAGERIVSRNAFLVKSQAMKGELGEEGEGEPK
jgi:RND family efflux transporter MFP subunit